MTIDERAKAYMHNEITQPQRLAMYEAYKDGAYDQRQIDLDKACEVFGIQIRDLDPAHYNYDYERMYEEALNEFRKAMEEEQ